jgi:hypothetical protein
LVVIFNQFGQKVLLLDVVFADGVLFTEFQLKDKVFAYEGFHLLLRGNLLNLINFAVSLLAKDIFLTALLYEVGEQLHLGLFLFQIDAYSQLRQGIWVLHSLFAGFAQVYIGDVGINKILLGFVAESTPEALVKSTLGAAGMTADVVVMEIGAIALAAYERAFVLQHFVLVFFADMGVCLFC